MKATATLQDWLLTRSADNCLRATGRVYGDIKDRFNDGASITTSPVVLIDIGSRILVTENSIYAVGRPLW